MERFSIGDTLPENLLPLLKQNEFTIVANGNTFDVYGLLDEITESEADYMTNHTLALYFIIIDDIPFIIGTYEETFLETYFNMHEIDKETRTKWLNDSEDWIVNFYLVESQTLICRAVRTVYIGLIMELKEALKNQLKIYPDSESVEKRVQKIQSNYNPMDMRLIAPIVSVFG